MEWKPSNHKQMKLWKSLFCKQLTCTDVFEMSMAFQASSLFGSVATLQETGEQNAGARARWGRQSQSQEAEALRRNSEKKTQLWETNILCVRASNLPGKTSEFLYYGDSWAGRGKISSKTFDQVFWIDWDSLLRLSLWLHAFHLSVSQYTCLSVLKIFALWKEQRLISWLKHPFEKYFVVYDKVSIRV